LIFSAAFVAFAAVFVFWIAFVKHWEKNSAPKEEIRGSASENFYDPLITRVPSVKISEPTADDQDPFFGDRSASVKIFVYGDFDCAFCREEILNLKKIVGEYPNFVLFWKNYPDRDQNSQSYQAALAGYCANEQNRFWELETVLPGEERLTENSVSAAAETAGLNKKEYENCLASGRGEEKIGRDIAEADALEINGVPFVFFGRQEIMGRASLDELRKMAEIELNSTEKRPQPHY